MNRPWRTRPINRNHSCQRPSNLLFVDVETRPYLIERETTYQEHHIRLGWACYVSWPQKRQPKEEWCYFDTAAKFWDFLESKLANRRVLWVYAHNAVFDLTVLRLWERIERKTLVCDRPGKSYRDPHTGSDRQSADWHGTKAIDGIPFWLECEWRYRRINFADSMNYFPCSLADMGKCLGTYKLPMPDFNDSDDRWSSYCKNDVEILKRSMLGLMEEWQHGDYGNWQPTAASLSWSHYRHQHMPNPIVVHEHGNARDLEWASYYGGECRAFYRGACPGPTAHYDVNSLYPAVMYGNYYPSELIDYILCPNPGIVDSLITRFCVIAEVTLETVRDEYPFRKDGRVVYPIGSYRTALAGPEFIRAWQAGEVRTVHAAAYYKRAVLFSSYVEQWFAAKRAARIQGNTSREKLSKLLLNSLYGKWVQRTPVWEDESRVEVVRPWQTFPWRDPETKTVWPARSIGWVGQVARFRRDCAHTFPAIAAYVTSYARVRMRELRQRFAANAVYYQDTDSIVIDHVAELGNGPRSMPLGDGLGELRRIGTYDSMVIRGPKNYTADGRHVIAGVRAKDVEERDMQWTGERFERSGSIVTRQPDGTIRSFTRNYETPGSCLEGGYGPDGWYFPVKLG